MHLFSDIGPICQYKLIFLDNTVGSTLLPSADFVDNVIISYYLNNASSSIVLTMYLLCIYLLLLSGSATQHSSGQSPHFLGYTLSTKHNEPWLSACILIVMRETFSKYNNHLCAINMTDRLCITLYGKIRKNIQVISKSLNGVISLQHY